MNKNFLDKESHEFYRRFKELSKEGQEIEVIMGAKERKLTIKSASKTIKYDGGLARELLKRVHRNISEDTPDSTHIVMHLNSDDAKNREIRLMYKHWNKNRVSLALSEMKKRKWIYEFSIS